MDYILSSCSTADLTEEHFKKRNINYICFHYTLDGKEYLDDLGKSIPFSKFYELMASGSEIKTSQVNSDEFYNYFKRFLEEGKDILHLTLSNGISGVINSANIAADMLRDEFPNRKIYIVDSLGASSGYGLFMDHLADLRDSGMSIDDLYQYALDNRLRLNHWFFSTDLTFYVKGGRISKAAGWFGTALKICPLLNMDDKGRLIPRYKCIGKRMVIKRIVDKMIECADKGLDYDGKCYISEAGCMEDAMAVKKSVEATFKHLNGEVEINSVGTTIGAHTGPGTVALFFFGKKREN